MPNTDQESKSSVEEEEERLQKTEDRKQIGLALWALLLVVVAAASAGGLFLDVARSLLQKIAR